MGVSCTVAITFSGSHDCLIHSCPHLYSDMGRCNFFYSIIHIRMPYIGLQIASWSILSIESDKMKDSKARM